MIDVRWVWLHLHHQEGVADRGEEYWREVTGWGLSPRRGGRGEHATLLPVDGDPWVKLQRTRSGTGIHLDLSVDDVDAAAAEATRLGASRAAGSGDDVPGLRVVRSPGGFCFCLTEHAAEGGPSRQVRTGPSLLDQACLDIPADLMAAECAFWADLTGWERWQPGEEYSALRAPEGIPLRLLLQRLGEDDGASAVRGHPDVACADRLADLPRWEAAGAEEVGRFPWWSVMRDPAGLVFCLTDRDPVTGRVLARAGWRP